ncbi:peptidase S41 [Tamlana sp. 62-3]|uniref:Peptidase S41 n=1 Tax=Neotamlana sargassicola TaxID=2883125 RepID=A0A9X1IAK2_9FLAO|nr:S41 family peptidase [Tamlana sargassicola]MCB4809379.1 peptidase S41 [Tamlana sargassicola]
MKYFFILILIAFCFSSCNSVKKYNEQVNTLHSVEHLKEDVDKLYNQLKKHHPKLYQYSTESDLNNKFDSLKQTINKPLSTRAFYKKIAPVVSYVKQGHVSTGYTVKRFTKKERKKLKKQKLDFYNLEFEFIDDKLWVKNNYGKDSTIIGSEIIKIEDDSVSNLIKTYKTRFASDGFNTTLHNRYVAKAFSVFYTRDKGFLDSLSVTLKQNDSLFVKKFKRITQEENKELNDSISTKKEKPLKLTKTEKQNNRIAKRKRKKYNKKHGFITKSKTYTRNFEFKGVDSTVAYVKIRSFTNGNYKKFYKEVFKTLDSLKTQNLVIDLRDNGGGRISEIDYLYSYLTLTDYQFLNPSQVNSRVPFFKVLMTNTMPNTAKVVSGILSPFIVTHNFLNTYKNDGKIYYKFKKYTKIKSPKPLHFKGNIYVLINGNSFSASSLISTHLKANNRAIFVGEETGGAYNGCVAGIYKVYQLPTSKLKIRIGMMQIEAPQKQQPDGFGIKPDVHIIPTENDRKLNKDPELEWVLNKIAS